MEKEIMSFDEVFSGKYSDDREGVLSALKLFAENYARINSIHERRAHNRNTFSLLRKIS